MVLADTKPMIQRALDAMITGDELAMGELLSPDYVMHVRGRGDVVGLEACLNHFAAYREAIPDQHWTVEDQIAEGDKVVVLWTLRGTHAGELMGIPPTGRQVTMTGISVFRIAGGKLVEDWVQSDTLGLFQQLGAVPTSTKVAS
jgi:steroid delta-isomerase-like uncharacterized protein